MASFFFPPISVNSVKYHSSQRNTRDFVNKNKLADLSSGNNQIEKQESFGELSSSNVNNIMMFILGKPFNAVYNVTAYFIYGGGLWGIDMRRLGSLSS